MRRATLSIMLTALLILTAGCQNDPGGLDTPNDVQFQSVAKAGLTHLELLDSLDYEEFSGSIQPGNGGWLFCTMKTWPRNCTFNVMVPPDALPDDDSDHVDFTLRVPTYQSYLDHAADNLPLIIRLEPSDIRFNAPVLVMGTYMPWSGLTASDLFTYFTVAPVYEMFGEPSVYQDRQRVRIQFQAPHFSDWEVDGQVPDGMSGE